MDNFLIFSIAVDNLKIQVASVKSRIERAMKQPGFDAKEAASLTRQMDELNRWTQKLIELPEDSSGLLKINTHPFTHHFDNNRLVYGKIYYGEFENASPLL